MSKLDFVSKVGGQSANEARETKPGPAGRSAVDEARKLPHFALSASAQMSKPSRENSEPTQKAEFVREEARKFPRFPFSNSAEVVEVVGRSRITGRTADIAQKGCYIDTISPFAVKSTVVLRITRANQSFETGATVVYSKVGMGMGLLFTTTDAQQLRTLEDWLNELSGAAPSDVASDSSSIQFEPRRVPKHDAWSVVSDMILLLNRKAVLTDGEAKDMLQRLNSV